MPNTLHYHGHRERLRKRFKDGPEKLQDYEILELLLGYVLIRKDTKPIAKELLGRFKTLRGVLEASPEECKDIPGIGEGVANFFLLLKEFIPRYMESAVVHKEELCSPQSVAKIARERLGSKAREEIWAAYVDTGNRLIKWEKLTQGGLASAPISPRDIVERGLMLKASGFILVHNHPGGSSTPSGADMELTARIDMAAKTVFIRFIDHVIVTDTACYSIMSDGLL